jgi:hypothetical protein
MNGPMYGVRVQGIQPSTYDWSNVLGMSAGIQPSTYEGSPALRPHTLEH